MPDSPLMRLFIDFWTDFRSLRIPENQVFNKNESYNNNKGLIKITKGRP